MRIIAGDFKGRRLKTPAWAGLRPTSDKLRETLFNILAPRIDGARLVDAFAGSGAIGLEALSRGAAHVTFIDQDPRAVTLIEDNVRLCKVSDRSRVTRGDVTSVLGTLSTETPFDVIVLDPPYDMRRLADVLIAAGGCLASGGVMVLEHATRREPDIPASVIQMRTVKSGDSALTFLERRM